MNDRVKQNALINTDASAPKVFLTDGEKRWNDAVRRYNRENVLQLAARGVAIDDHAIARRLVRMRRDQDIKLIGFDYYDAVKPFIRSSAIDVIIGQSLPNQAYDAVKMMFYHLCYGVPLVNKDYNSRLDVIVSSNVDFLLRDNRIRHTFRHRTPAGAR